MILVVSEERRIDEKRQQTVVLRHWRQGSTELYLVTNETHNAAVVLRVTGIPEGRTLDPRFRIVMNDWAPMTFLCNLGNGAGVDATLTIWQKAVWPYDQPRPSEITDLAGDHWRLLDDLPKGAEPSREMLDQVWGDAPTSRP